MKTFTYIKNSKYLSEILAILSVVILGYYLFATNWQFIELLKFIIGSIFLWVPIGSIIYLFSRNQIQDKLICFTFSSIGSYAITTLLYFGFAVLKCEIFFYLIQIAIFLYFIIHSLRTRFWLKIEKNKINYKNLNWILITIIATSLAFNTVYQNPWIYSHESNLYTFNLLPDHLLHSSISYELTRNIPPFQMPNRAGLPFAPYHILSHLTTELISKYTGQTDILRAHIIYHYIVIESGICLALYCIAKILTKSKIARYIAASSIYITSIQYPSLYLHDHWPTYYFTVFPFSSSSLIPVIETLPQAYSCNLVLYGILLGVLLISKEFIHRKINSSIILIIAIMVASSLRINAHCFLPLMPSFLIICAGSWLKTKNKTFIYAILISLVISFLLYIEMKSSIYSSSALTNGAKIGFNALTTEWNGKIYPFNSWPTSHTIYKIINKLIFDDKLKKWVWQIISMTCFVLFNIIGIPLSIISSIYLFNKFKRRQYIFFSGLIVLLIFFSIIEGVLLTVPGDPYSLSSEILYNVGWYPFTILIPGLYEFYKYLTSKSLISKKIFMNIGIIIFLFSIMVNYHQQLTIIPFYANWDKGHHLNEIQMLKYIHDNTPLNSVILTEKYAYNKNFLLSGLTGRVSYYQPDFHGSEVIALKTRPLENRRKIIKDLWEATNSVDFCKIIHSTSAAYILQFSEKPFAVSSPSCLSLVHQISEKINSKETETVYLWNVNK